MVCPSYWVPVGLASCRVAPIPEVISSRKSLPDAVLMVTGEASVRVTTAGARHPVNVAPARAPAPGLVMAAAAVIALAPPLPIASVELSPAAVPEVFWLRVVIPGLGYVPVRTPPAVPFGGRAVGICPNAATSCAPLAFPTPVILLEPIAMA